MKTTRLVDIATKSILKNKMRTLLTMLGIIIGVGAVIVMVAVGQGAKGEIQRRIDNLGTNMIVVTQAANRQGGVSQGAGSAGRLTIDDYNALKREGLLLTQVSPVVIAPSQIIGGNNNWRSLVDGVSLDYQTIRAWTIASGRFFDQTDLQTRRKVAVIVMVAVGQGAKGEIQRRIDNLGTNM
ncbi:MAG TPA: ABC transporter permease, partial [Opitutaceae bacterium]|nr:ABC transporter permease [Opitutaceae bacterium]